MWHMALPGFYFVDNVFNLPPTYARQLCHSINQSGLEISWRCILYPGFIDEELVKAMATAGCVEASLGFESGDAGMLKSMGKHFEPGQVRAITGMLVRNGIRTSGFLLLGGPGETRESVLASLAFADSLHLGILKLTVGIRIYPETELERLARAKGMLEEGDDLLMPRFYLAPELREWLPAIVREWMTNAPPLHQLRRTRSVEHVHYPATPFTTLSGRTGHERRDVIGSKTDQSLPGFATFPADMGG